MKKIKNHPNGISAVGILGLPLMGRISKIIQVSVT